MHRDGVGITMGLFTSFNMNYFVMVRETIIFLIIERCSLFIIGTFNLDFKFSRVLGK